MNTLLLATREVRSNTASAALAVVLLALGIATLVVMLRFVSGLETRFERGARDVDLVVGAKGSPMQLILSGVYHVDAPSGNIPLSVVDELAGMPLVKQAIPLGLGDSYHGFRIVGAPVSYLDLYRAKLAQGRPHDGVFEAVLGAEVARASGLTIGSTFVGSHGLTAGGEAHGGTPYRVVGVLAPGNSPLDELVLTPIESVWSAHARGEEAHEGGADAETHAEETHKSAGSVGQVHDLATDRSQREVTVVLVQYASPLAGLQLPKLLNQRAGIQVASPPAEIARLMRMVGVGRDVFAGFAVMLICSSAAALLVAMISTLRSRQYDIAVMRLLGARRARVAGALFAEALVLATLGAVSGLMAGHAISLLLELWLAEAGVLPIELAPALAREVWLLPLSWLVGLLAALLPVWHAMRVDVVRLLTRS